jgi:hypothetical protein
MSVPSDSVLDGILLCKYVNAAAMSDTFWAILVRLHCIETAVIQRERKYDPAEGKVQGSCFQMLNTAADSRYCVLAALVPLCIGRKGRGILQQQLRCGDSIAMALEFAHCGIVLVFFVLSDPAHCGDVLVFFLLSDPAHCGVVLVFFLLSDPAHWGHMSEILVAFVSVPPHYCLSDSAASTLED